MIKIELSDLVRPMSFYANCNQIVLIIHSISNYHIFQTTLDVARLRSKGHFRRFQTHVEVGATLLPVNQPKFLKINRKKNMFRLTWVPKLSLVNHQWVSKLRVKRMATWAFTWGVNHWWLLLCVVFRTRVHNVVFPNPSPLFRRVPLHYVPCNHGYLEPLPHTPRYCFLHDHHPRRVPRVHHHCEVCQTARSPQQQTTFSQCGFGVWCQRWECFFTSLRDFAHSLCRMHLYISLDRRALVLALLLFEREPPVGCLPRFGSSKSWFPPSSV